MQQPIELNGWDGVTWDITCQGINYYKHKDDPSFWDIRYELISKSTYKRLRAYVDYQRKVDKAKDRRLRKFKLAKEKYLRNH